MSKITLCFLLIFLKCSCVFSQDYEELYNKMLHFKTPVEYDEMDCEMMEVTDYLLNICYNEERLQEDYGYKAMVNWMDNTEVYHVIEGGKVKENCPKRSVLLNISKISMTKYLFQNDSIVQYSGPVRYVNINRVREIINGGAEVFMEYLSIQEKATVKKHFNKELQKGFKMYKEGLLDEFMRPNKQQ